MAGGYRQTGAIAALWLAVWLACCGAVLAQPKFPALTGRVVDEAQLLTPAEEQELTASLAELEAKSTDQLVVYTAPTLQGYEIEDFGYQLGRHWGIGQKDKDNGVVLIVAPNERKVRIEVGRGLEPQLTDILSALIVQNAILPAFRRGDFPAGIKAGVRDIRDVLLGDAEAVRQRAQRPASRDAEAEEALFTFAVFVFFVLFIIWIQWRQSKVLPARGQNVRNRKGRRGDDFVFIPGGWSGGRGGGGGGGGWGGGGGGFGGGGSSGSW